MKGALDDLFVNPERAPCPGGWCCRSSLPIDAEFMGLLAALVERLGRKLVIRYFAKCVTFNRSIGGANDSHAVGRAVDVDTLQTGCEPAWLAEVAWQLGFNAVGVYGSNTRAGYKGKMAMVHLGLEAQCRFWGDWRPSSDGEAPVADGAAASPRR